MLTFVFFTDLATTEIYTLSLHDALPISAELDSECAWLLANAVLPAEVIRRNREIAEAALRPRSEEHTSELQSPYDLVCRLLLEKKKTYTHKVERHQSNKRCTHASKARAA